MTIVHFFDPDRAYKDLPKPPPDDYQWDKFFTDQTSRPLVFHGTSSVNEESIRKRGLTLTAAPYNSREVREVVDVFNRHHIYGDDEYNVATLQVFTASSAEMNSISFTFDYQRACQYATNYQGGETVDHLWNLLNWALESSNAAFTESERGFLADYRDRLEPMVRAHKPMVVATEFALEDFAGEHAGRDLAFFRDRNVFAKLLDEFGPTLFLGYYSQGFISRGHEYLATKAISPNRIRHFLFPSGRIVAI